MSKNIRALDRSILKISLPRFSLPCGTFSTFHFFLLPLKTVGFFFVCFHRLYILKKRTPARSILKFCRFILVFISFAQNNAPVRSIRKNSIVIPHMPVGFWLFRCTVARHVVDTLPSRKHLGRALVRFRITRSLETSSKNRRSMLIFDQTIGDFAFKVVLLEGS